MGGTVCVDTHCHLSLMGDFVAIEQVLQDAREHGVEKVFTIATNLADSISCVAIAKAFPAVWTAVGVHPCDCGAGWQDEMGQIKAMLDDREENNIVALGETGLDFYHKPFDKALQIDVFRMHIEYAVAYDLPIVIHIRDSAQEVLRVLEEYVGRARGVAHCFSQTDDIAQVLLDWGFYLGIGGPITYPKNDALRDLFRNMPIGCMLLETDAPFLPPQTFRGQKNHPKYIPLIAQAIADIRGVDISVVCEETTKNVEQLFGV